MHFSQNPYRVIGVPSNSGIKIIQKNLSKLKAFSKLGKDLEFDFDFSFLNLDKIDRSSVVISKVESKILLDENKLKYGLFWFQDITSYDSIALAKLVKGDTDKALEIWDKAMKSGEVSVKNFSAFNNASSLLLLLQLDESKKDQFKNNNSSINKLKEALGQKIKLIKSDFFPEYCLSLGIKSDINVPAIQSFLADKILEILNQNFSNKQLLEVVNDLDESFSELINSNLVKEPISNIKEQFNLAVLELKNNVKDGLLIGKTLIKNTVTDLRYLKQTLGENHYQYESLADKVSNQIIQCGILYFNETGDDQIYLNSYKYALSIAPNEKTKTRAKDCVKHCEQEKDANICKFCNIADVSSSNGLRVKMHKMTSYSQYTYFKNGGLELKCCSSCKSKKNMTKILAPVLATITYGLVTALTSGILIGIDLIFAQFNIAKWWFHLINKQIYFNSVKDHPLIKISVTQGYDFGMP
jgi:tetratricopeptide (TPR) repeat protein